MERNGNGVGVIKPRLLAIRTPLRKTQPILIAVYNQILSNLLLCPLPQKGILIVFSQPMPPVLILPILNRGPLTIGPPRGDESDNILS
jgi:hypothetical protein